MSRKGLLCHAPRLCGRVIHSACHPQGCSGGRPQWSRSRRSDLRACHSSGCWGKGSPSFFSVSSPSVEISRTRAYRTLGLRQLTYNNSTLNSTLTDVRGPHSSLPSNYQLTNSLYQSIPNTLILKTWVPKAVILGAVRDMYWLDVQDVNKSVGQQDLVLTASTTAASVGDASPEGTSW